MEGVRLRASPIDRTGAAHSPHAPFASRFLPFPTPPSDRSSPRFMESPLLRHAVPHASLERDEGAFGKGGFGPCKRPGLSGQLDALECAPPAAARPRGARVSRACCPRGNGGPSVGVSAACRGRAGRSGPRDALWPCIAALAAPSTAHATPPAAARALRRLAEVLPRASLRQLPSPGLSGALLGLTRGRCAAVASSPTCSRCCDAWSTRPENSWAARCSAFRIGRRAPRRRTSTASLHSVRASALCAFLLPRRWLTGSPTQTAPAPSRR